jgi:uncharacterized pyridoxal phosphate-containing UPF0001 family protein
MVESVDSLKVANHLDHAVSGLGRQPLRVLVQVNTSGEKSKFGVEPSECVQLAKHVKKECPNLLFSGLMTIGMLDYTSTPENFQVMLVPGFQNLGFGIDSWSSGNVGFMDQDARVEIVEAYMCFFLSITEGTCVCSQCSSILSITLFWMQTLANCREKVCRELDIPEHECELSMGMSSDFENAIEMGSTNVRVGTTIFGPREYT